MEHSGASNDLSSTFTNTFDVGVMNLSHNVYFIANFALHAQDSLTLQMGQSLQPSNVMFPASHKTISWKLTTPIR